MFGQSGPARFASVRQKVKDPEPFFQGRSPRLLLGAAFSHLTRAAVNAMDSQGLV